MGLNGFISKKNIIQKREKKPGIRLGFACLIHNTANPANFHPNWAELSVLLNRQILNSSGFFSLFYIMILIYFLKYDFIDPFPHIFHRYYFVYSWSALLVIKKIPKSKWKQERFVKSVFRKHSRRKGQNFLSRQMLFQFFRVEHYLRLGTKKRQGNF